METILVVKRFSLVDSLSGKVKEISVGEKSPFKPKEHEKVIEQVLSPPELLVTLHEARRAHYPSIYEFLDAFYHERMGNSAYMKRYLKRVSIVKADIPIPKYCRPHYLVDVKPLSLWERVKNVAKAFRGLVNSLRKGYQRRRNALLPQKTK